VYWAPRKEISAAFCPQISIQMLQVGGSEKKKNYLSESDNSESEEECRGNEFLGAKRTTAKLAKASIIYSLCATRKHACDYLKLPRSKHSRFFVSSPLLQRYLFFICPMCLFIDEAPWRKLNLLIILYQKQMEINTCFSFSLQTKLQFF
jgi:hypothetical protein